MGVLQTCIGCHHRIGPEPSSLGQDEAFKFSPHTTARLCFRQLLGEIRCVAEPISTSSSPAPTSVLPLTDEELHRYSRHLLLPGVGKAGQERLKAARVLVVGMGGLGSPASLYLAAAGIGTLGVIDDDQVSLSNLQRQVLYSTSDAEAPKAERAAARLSGLNPNVKLKIITEKLTRKNAREIVREYDLVLDGTDNFDSRYVIGRACKEASIPHLYAGIFRFEGQLALFEPAGPCYACLYPSPPQQEEVPNCSEAGVLGPLAGVLGTLQALEVLKYFLDLRESRNELFIFDGLSLRSQSLKISKRPGCSICESTHADFWQEAAPGSAEGSNAGSPGPKSEIRTLREIPEDAYVLDVRNEDEIRELPLPTLAARIKHIPLPELKSRLGELDPAITYVTVCRSGQRSLRAQEILNSAGFKSVVNLKSGLSG